MAYVKINDISMYYERHGKGEPIVFIAGFGADHTIWSQLLPHFKDKHEIILFDNRGAGQTDAPEELYSIEQMANDVAMLCAHLEIEKAHFVGNSMGGFILQNLAYRHSQLVKSAIISHSVATMEIPFHLYVKAQLELIKAQVPQEILIKALCSWLFSFQFLSQPGMLDQLIEIGVCNPYPFTIEGYEGQYAALTQFDSSAWLHHIRVPTLVLASDQDLIFRESLVKSLAACIPGARYYCFTQCGHLPQLEYPEKLSQIIKEFISASGIPFP